ncbi:hypothetical protein TCAL_02155 [Tigriopus californicus]|uniref:G-protein coupled receptors family 1 profile domain-containing protein n=2 Tax=Tigriopus californicus TaxID=6832 RepID=A0A553N791_TIGCA|nr:hypothetical protein TCAL_02155 [Tigriopus californicus]|eukprot:TCALIF_02155-PA protein Name:"Similar to FR FMRFamide receptor (Drosophila melanogaster)" AED:0.07 eAED:0.09 QI:0/-1/0/1/-1/1/1/0/444
MEATSANFEDLVFVDPLSVGRTNGTLKTELSSFSSTISPEDARSSQIISLQAASIFWFEGVWVPIIGSIGIIGNVLSILVLTKRDLDLKSSFVNLLITLCVFDIFFIVAVNLFYSLPIHSRFYEVEILPYMTPLLLPLIHIVLTGSVYSVVAVAVERYFIICNPFNIVNQGRGFRYIILIVIFSTLYNLNKFFEVTVGYATVTREYWNVTSQSIQEENVTQAKVVVTSIRGNAEYTKIVIILNFIVMVVIPLMVLSICHIFTFKAIHKTTHFHNAISSHQRRDNAMAMLFFFIILCFVICHSGKFTLNFFEMSRIATQEKDKEWPLWAFILARINHLMLVINSSVNFFIYCFRDARFRTALFSLLGLKSCHSLLASEEPIDHTCIPGSIRRSRRSHNNNYSTNNGNPCNGQSVREIQDSGEDVELNTVTINTVVCGINAEPHPV